ELHDERRDREDAFGAELAQQPGYLVRRLPLVRDPTEHVLLRERLPEVDRAELQPRRIGVRPFESSLAGHERAAVQMEHLVAAAGEGARELSRERVAEVVVDDDAHSAPGARLRDWRPLLERLPPGAV